MKRKLVAANWKMNLLKEEAVENIFRLENHISQKEMHCELQIFVPSIYIDFILNNSQLTVGAQNVHWENQGAFTGEISALQLKSIGCDHLLIGHSERRDFFFEDDFIIEKKIHQSLSNGFNVILCVGESLKIRNQNEHLAFVSSQLNSALRKIDKEMVHQLTIAYEPIWAIGTGLTAELEQIEEMHNHIRSVLTSIFHNQHRSVRILYGGSCNEKNAHQIFSCSNVDGGLIGGASLDFDKFSKIIEIANDLSRAGH